jgi:copper chaperone NosL
MAISERRYAAELVAPDGEAAKFDELGCLLRYLEGAGSRDWRGGFFVVDVETGEWLHAGEAFFVRSREFKTPMGGGIIAFRERHRAEASSRRHGGELLGFEELIRVRPSGP